MKTVCVLLLLNIENKCEENMCIFLSCQFPCTSTNKLFQTEVLTFNVRVYLLKILSNVRVGKIPLDS